MGLFDLLDIVKNATPEEKEKILKEEYQRQKKYIDALCNVKREEEE